MRRESLRKLGIALVILLANASVLCAQAVLLTADGVTPAETRAGNILKASPETPDCSHLSFGPHITQAPDSILGKYAFVFNMHVVPDNDRCSHTDRQRLEIKTEGHSNPSPYDDYIVGHLGDTVTFRWKFMLPAGFQPSYSFTHIHQIKAYDGDGRHATIFGRHLPKAPFEVTREIRRAPVSHGRGSLLDAQMILD